MEAVKGGYRKVIGNYELLEVIGSGQYGEVYRGLHKLKRNEKAIKVIKISKFKEIPKLEEFILNETRALAKVNHPNVIKLEDTCQSQNHLYLVYEFCEGGTLEDLIKKNGHLSEKESLELLNQILSAFKTLFQYHILHRDLKPSNILFKNNVLKVADFGFCKPLNSPFDLSHTMVGSPIYMAPEILFGHPYTIKADVWSIGIVFYEMLFGKCPYFDYNLQNLMYKIENIPLEFPRNINQISKKSENLLRQMLVVKPEYRIDWKNLLSIQNFESTQREITSRNSFSNQNTQIVPSLKSREYRNTHHFYSFHENFENGSNKNRRESENSIGKQNKEMIPSDIQNNSEKKMKFGRTENSPLEIGSQRNLQKIFGMNSPISQNNQRILKMERIDPQKRISFIPNIPSTNVFGDFEKIETRRAHSFVEINQISTQNQVSNALETNQIPKKEKFEGIWDNKEYETGSFVEIEKAKRKEHSLINYSKEGLIPFKFSKEISYSPKHIQEIIRNSSGRKSDFNSFTKGNDPIPFPKSQLASFHRIASHRKTIEETNSFSNGEDNQGRKKKIRIMRDVLNRISAFPLDSRSSLLMTLHLSRKIVAEGKQLLKAIKKSLNSILVQSIEREVECDQIELSKLSKIFEQRFGFGSEMGDFSSAEEKYFKEISLDYSKKLREKSILNTQRENDIYFLALSLLLCADNRTEEIPAVPLQDKTFLKDSVLSLESKLSSASTTEN